MSCSSARDTACPMPEEPRTPDAADLLRDAIEVVGHREMDAATRFQGEDRFAEERG